jgi:hypothetical protein
MTQGGFGVNLQIDVGTVLTAVTKVEEVTFPEFEKILAESTGHDSAGGYAEFIATGKRRLNEFTVSLIWDTSEATHAAMVTAFDSDAAVTCSVADPDGDETIQFEAHIRTVNRMTEQEDAFKAEVAIQPTGQPTIT